MKKLRVFKKSEVKKLASKCKTRSEFARKFDGAYRFVKKQGWDEEIFRHMKPYNNWTKTTVLREARKYKRQIDFKNNSIGAYHAAFRLGIMDQIAQQMKPVRRWSKDKVLLEASKFKTKVEFLKNMKGAYAYAVKHNFLDEACRHMERRINPAGFWTFDRVLKEAKKFRRISDFKKKCEVAYNKVKRNGWENKVFLHMEKVGNLHLRAVYIYEFSDRSVYVGITSDYSRRYKQHHTNNRNRHNVVYRKIRSGASYRYYEQNEWFSKENIGKEEAWWINWYKKNGWNILNQAQAGGLGGGYQKWTKDKCLKEALKYKSRTEWQKKGSKSAYNAAHKNSWLDEICGHMRKVNKVKQGYWNLENCLSAARKCKDYDDFRLSYRGAYLAVRKNNWFGNIKKVFTN